jgi:hypothetical protein
VRSEEAVVSEVGRALAVVELVGMVVVAAALMRALAERRPAGRVLAAAVVFGVVFANPFGVVADRSLVDPRPLTLSNVKDRAAHWVKVGPIPLAWFRPYDERLLHAGWFENAPESVLKLRYGFALLPSTGASTVVAQCSNSISDPCWDGYRYDPSARVDYPLVHHDRDGRTWVVPLGRAHLVGVGPSSYVHVPQFYEVRLGLASRRALVYWLVLALVAALVSRNVRVRWADVRPLALGVAGVGVGVTLIAASTSAARRSATEQQPPVLAKPAAPSRTAGRVDPVAIADEPYDAGCVEREDGRINFRCSRPEQLAAADSAGPALAVWTSQPALDYETTLRGRLLTAEGEPLGPSVALVPSWPSSERPGTANCAIPVDVQAVSAPNDRWLVAWSDSCPYPEESAPVAIRGALLDRRLRLVRGPFAITRFRQGVTTPPPSFWLRATTRGDALLVRTGQARDDPYRSTVFASFLDANHRESRPVDLGEGSAIAVACGATCAVANADSGTLSVRFLSPHASIAARSSVEQGERPLYSELVATARGNRIWIGWLESAGVDADARVATFRPGRSATVATVAGDVANGDASKPSVPQPLGIVLGAGGASLVWQTEVRVRGRPQLRLHRASSSTHAAYVVGAALSEGSIVGDGTLVAAAHADGLPSAVAIRLP